ncbi:hypothetical protein JCM8097_002925 [Rhodosporidiobolus ruineniae]
MASSSSSPLGPTPTALSLFDSLASPGALLSSAVSTFSSSTRPRRFAGLIDASQASGDDLEDLDDALQLFATAAVFWLGIVVWDTLATFPREYKYMWRAKWSFLKVAFLVNRYWLLTSMVVRIWLVKSTISAGASLSALIWETLLTILGLVDLCTRIAGLHPASTTITIAACGCILGIRLYALYDRSRKILVLLAVLLFAELSIMIGVASQSRAIVFPPSSPHTFTGCMARQPQRLSPRYWSACLAFESACLGLLVYRVRIVLRRKSGPLPILTVLLRHGLFYFVAVFFSGLANIIFYTQPNPAWRIFNVPGSAALMSLMASRLTLSLHASKDYLFTCVSPSLPLAQSHHPHPHDGDYPHHPHTQFGTTATPTCPSFFLTLDGESPGYTSGGSRKVGGEKGARGFFSPSWAGSPATTSSPPGSKRSPPTLDRKRSSRSSRPVELDLGLELDLFALGRGTRGREVFPPAGAGEPCSPPPPFSPASPSPSRFRPALPTLASLPRLPLLAHSSSHTSFSLSPPLPFGVGGDDHTPPTVPPSSPKEPRERGRMSPFPLFYGRTSPLPPPSSSSSSSPSSPASPTFSLPRRSTKPSLSTSTTQSKSTSRGKSLEGRIVVHRSTLVTLSERPRTAEREEEERWDGRVVSPGAVPVGGRRKMEPREAVVGEAV